MLHAPAVLHPIYVNINVLGQHIQFRESLLPSGLERSAKTIKKKAHRTAVLPVALSGCETWPFTLQ